MSRLIDLEALHRMTIFSHVTPQVGDLVCPVNASDLQDFEDSQRWTPAKYVWGYSNPKTKHRIDRGELTQICRINPGKLVFATIISLETVLGTEWAQVLLLQNGGEIWWFRLTDLALFSWE